MPTSTQKYARSHQPKPLRALFALSDRFRNKPAIGLLLGILLSLPAWAVLAVLAWMFV